MPGTGVGNEAVASMAKSYWVFMFLEQKSEREH